MPARIFILEIFSQMLWIGQNLTLWQSEFFEASGLLRGCYTVYLAHSESFKWATGSNLMYEFAEVLSNTPLPSPRSTHMGKNSNQIHAFPLHFTFPCIR